MYKQSLTLIFMLAALMALGQSTPADTTYWLSGGQADLTFSQVNLTNWAAGGQNSTAWNSSFSFFADRNKNRSKWTNNIDLGYGIIKQGADSRFLKSDDRISLVANYQYRITPEGERWFYYILADFRTQFAEGFAVDNLDSLISNFMAPGYLSIATGITYEPLPFLTFKFSPFTSKMTFVSDDELAALGAYGVDPGRNFRSETGVSFRAMYKHEPFKNVSLDSRLDLFSSYKSEDFGNIDVNWTNSLNLQINSFLTTKLFTQLIYDDDIKIDQDTDDDGTVDQTSPEIQFKSVFSLGLVWQFGATRPE